MLTAATARFRNVPGPYTTCAGRAFISLPHGLFHPPYGVADPAGAGVNASSCWFATSTWPARHASSWLTAARSFVSTRSVSGSRIRITTGSLPKCWLSSRLALNVGEDRLTNVSLFVFGSSRSASAPPPKASASTTPSVTAGLLAAARASRSNNRPIIAQSIASGPCDSPERNWRMNGLSELSMSSAGPASTIRPFHSTLM